MKKIIIPAFLVFLLLVIFIGVFKVPSEKTDEKTREVVEYQVSEKIQMISEMINQTYHYDGCNDFHRCKDGIKRAVGLLEEIIQRNKQDIDAYKLLADAYSKLATAYSDQGSEEQLQYMTKSNEIYDMLYKSFPYDYQVWVNTTLKGNTIEEIVSFYEKMLEHEPDNAQINYHLGYLYTYRLKQFKRGIDFYMRGFEIDENPDSKVTNGKSIYCLLLRENNYERKEKIKLIVLDLLGESKDKEQLLSKCH